MTTGDSHIGSNSQHRLSDQVSANTVECQLDQVFAHSVRNAVPHAIRTRWPILQGRRPTPAVPVIPAVKGCSSNPQFGQGLTDRQRRVLNQPDDLQLLGAGISHASSSPAPIALFFSRRFSSVSSATTSFSALASRRSSLTSSEVAARAVSPARRFLPASRNSFDQR